MSDDILTEYEKLLAERLDKAAGIELPSIHFDKSGEEISFGVWAMLQQHTDYCIVARTEVGSYLVSTVWLGMDYGHGPPMVFESMVFYKGHIDEGTMAGEMNRYHTEDEAIAGHQRLVELVQLEIRATD